MINNDSKYQYILEQIHELNRRSLLNDNEKLDEIFLKISNFEKSILNKNNETEKKHFYILIGSIGINLLISFILLIYVLSIPKQIVTNENIASNIEKKDENKTENSENKDILYLKKSEVKIDEKYIEVSPTIRKDTIYYCEDDENSYKLPYTVEIKGKLYSDRFIFILNESDISKNCYIKKENL